MSTTEWRPWKSHYDVSRDGRVRNRLTGKQIATRIMHRSKHHRGHIMVSIRVDGRYLHTYLHTALLEAFVGPRPEGMIARHINDDKLDNRLENLAWGTRAENYEDAARNGCFRLGEDCSWSRLTETQVRDILSSSETQQALADRYGVARTTIQCIRNRRNWKWVTV